MMKHQFKTMAVCLLVVWLMISAILSVSAQQPEVVFTIGSIEGRPGDTIYVPVSVSGTEEINSIALYQLSYDSDVLIFEGFSDFQEIESKCIFSGGFDEKMQVVTLALRKSEALQSFICHLKFIVQEHAVSGDTTVSMSSIAKNSSVSVSSSVVEGVVSIQGKEETHTHTMIFAAAQTPNCHTSGSIAYWKCTSCGQTFRDALGTDVCTELTLPKDSSVHEGGTVIRDASAATASEPGYTGDTYCLGCGSRLRMGSVIAALGTPSADHTEDDIPTTAVPWNNPFADVAEDAAYFEAVRFVYENKLFYGVSDTEFAPEKEMTRSMFVTVLGRLAGIDPDAYTEVRFADVVPGEWYAPYVEWAAQNQIVNGYGNGLYGVNDFITMEQAAVILARYAEFIGVNIACDAPLSAYQDAVEVSDWAAEQLAWTVETGIYETDSAHLYPLSLSRRYQLAEMLRVFVNKFC